MITELRYKIASENDNVVVHATLQKLGEALYLHNAEAEECDTVADSIDYLASCGVLE